MIFSSFDAKKIFIREWLDVAEPRGVIQIAHGMAEHSGRYDNFAKFMNKNGYIVIADDHRGHGETDSESLGYCEGDMFNDTLRDMAAIARDYREKYKGLKYILFGFSYGSFLAQAFMSRFSRYVDAVILGGSAYKKGFDIELGKLVANCGSIFKDEKKPAKVIEELSFGAYEKKFADGEWLSNNIESNEKYRADKYCGFTLSNNFYVSFFNGLSELYTKSYAEGLKVKMPVLIISGGEDAVGGKGKLVKKLDRYYKKVGMQHIQTELLSGSRHEFLNEVENCDKALNIMLKFLQDL